LLLVEELPNLQHVLKMVSRHLVEVPLLRRQLLLVLLLQNLEIEVEEPLDFRSVIGLEAVDVIKKVVEGA
jgi:hypothetical protein|tara:strand:+ start:625 stop:834 length:210 start_codon:yes stop_codon:yes gene_type:complete